MSLTWTYLLFIVRSVYRVRIINTRKALYPRLLSSNILCRPNCMHTVNYIYLLHTPYLKFWRSQSFSRHSYVRWFLLASPQRSELEQKVSLFETTANKFYVRKTCSLIISFNIFRSCSRFVSFTKRPQGSLKRCCLILATRNPNSTLNPLSVTMVVPLIQFISFFCVETFFRVTRIHSAPAHSITWTCTSAMSQPLPLSSDFSTVDHYRSPLSDLRPSLLLGLLWSSLIFACWPRHARCVSTCLSNESRQLPPTHRALLSRSVVMSSCCCCCRYHCTTG